MFHLDQGWNKVKSELYDLLYELFFFVKWSDVQFILLGDIPINN